MKTPLFLSLTAGMLILVAAPLQAAYQPYSASLKIAQGSTPTGTAGNTVPADTTTTPTNGAAANAPLGATQKAVVPPVSNNTQIDIHPPADTSTKAAPPPVNTNTRVEVQNQPPAANPPANVNIKMPDVNVAAPAATAPKDTVTEHSTTVITEKAPDQQPQSDNTMALAIFGALALLIVVGFAIVMMRRNSAETTP